MFRKYRVVWIVLAVLILIVLWYLFRPEKLWINHKVDEPPPASLLGVPAGVRAGAAVHTA
jgi:hypothetical protein